MSLLPTASPPARLGAAATIQHLGFASGRATPIYRKESDGDFFYQSLTVSPDEQWLLFSEAPGWQPELMLMENFR